MYLRFVIAKKDEDSGRRQGLFQALADLDYADLLSSDERENYERLKKWFNAELKKPRSFSRSSKASAKNVAIGWFKDTAGEHIANMRELALILDVHGIRTETIWTDRPGYIVYEDDFQIAAVPFGETGA